MIIKNLAPANTGRGHWYMVGIAFPVLGDLRVGLAHKVLLDAFANGSICKWWAAAFFKERHSSTAENVALDFCANRHPTIYIANSFLILRLSGLTILFLHGARSSTVQKQKDRCAWKRKRTRLDQSDCFVLSLVHEQLPSVSLQWQNLIGIYLSN